MKLIYFILCHLGLHKKAMRIRPSKKRDFKSGYGTFYFETYCKRCDRIYKGEKRGWIKSTK